MTVAGLEALRAKANVQGRADAIEQFRADFKLVWRMEYAHGHLSEAEIEIAYQNASQAVQQRTVDPAWMGYSAASFSTMANAIRRDQERSERIRAEMASAKEPT
jgi:hypothetical protein